MTTAEPLVISSADYHADKFSDQPCLSASIAKIICSQSPLHAWFAHPKLNPKYREETAEHFDIGAAAHGVLLEGNGRVSVIDATDWRTKAAKEKRDEARANGLTPLLAHQWFKVKAMVEAARAQLLAHKEASDAFTGGKPEQTLVWQETLGAVSVKCKARLDWLHDDHLTVDDFKTVGRSANPEDFTRQIFSLGYDVQAAFYLRGVNAVFGTDATFRFIAQETEEPFALSVVGLCPDALAIGQKKVFHAIGVWAACLATGQWPGYPSRICWAELPPWEETKWLRRETEDE